MVWNTYKRLFPFGKKCNEGGSRVFKGKITSKDSEQLKKQDFAAQLCTSSPDEPNFSSILELTTKDSSNHRQSTQTSNLN